MPLPYAGKSLQRFHIHHSLITFKCQSDIFHVNLPKPIRVLHGRSEERSTVEADGTYIKHYINVF